MAGYFGTTLVVRVSVRPCVRCRSVRIFVRDDNLSKCKWIFTYVGMCTDIVEIWFGIPEGQISVLTELSALDTSIF